MTEEIHPYPKEIDAPYKRINEDDLASDIPPDAGTDRLRLFGRILGIVLAVVINIVLYVAINYYYKYIPFLTDDFTKWRPYVNISIFANVLIKFLLLFFGDTVFKPLLEAGANAVTVVSMIALLVIFPIDLDIITWLGPLEDIMRFGMIAVILILIVVTIANVASFFSNLLKAD